MNNTQNTNGRHTKGPWKIIEVTESCTSIQSVIDREDGRGSYIAEINWEPDGVNVSGPLLPADKANARLISAAPELLEALKQLIEHIEWREDFLIEDAEEGNQNAYTLAKAAINKATI